MGLERKTFRNLSSVFACLCERGFGLAKVNQPLFKFGCVNVRPREEAGILNARRGRNRQQLGPPEMFVGVAIGISMPDGEESQIFAGCQQGHGEPGPQVAVAFESLPFCFLFCVRDQYAFPVVEDAFQERRFVGNESQRKSGMVFR